ncbi:MAG: methylated-DNA--[protein]-cysteine S-methyltransferase [Pseudomonadota bacterium]
MFYTWMDSPIGKLLLAGDENALHLISFTTGKIVHQPKPEWIEDEKPFAEPIKQLKAYFAGKLKDFSLKLAPNGTAFQLEVLEALQKIPYGETVSYGEMAKRVGRPKASRAVGAANGRNPLPIVIPCHRVIGSNGSLTGFGGGLDTKQTLLAHEQKYA